MSKKAKDPGPSAATADAPVPASPDEIEDSIDEGAEQPAVRYMIATHGADYPVDALIQRLKSDDIVIPRFDPNVAVSGSEPGFQRDFVWTKRLSDRFIESLLFGFPVPGIFLFRDAEKRLLVVDGQQRLMTLRAFYDGFLNGSAFTLDDVHEEWKGKSYATLSPADRRRLNDSIIHATIIRQEEPADNLNSIYLVFERLNSGGIELNPQQIRVALYRGPFVELIRKLNELKDWRALVGKKSRTLKDQELLLRCLAMVHSRSAYKRPMKEFLNDFLDDHRALGSPLTAARLEEDVKSVTSTIRATLGDRAFRLKSTVNAALAEAIYVGVAERLSVRGKPAGPAIKKMSSGFTKLLENERFVDVVTRATADEDSVATRIDLAIKALGA